MQRLLVAALCVASLVARAGTAAPTPQQQERDHILSLAALAVVHRDWQAAPDARGHNIGAILADADSVPVFWARNTVSMSDNASQHGEMRLIQEYLNCKGVGKYAKGLTVYTTLEPCAMCAGMMAFTKVSRVVYVQADPEFGKAHAALAAIEYPRLFTLHSPHGLPQKAALEAGYRHYRQAESQGSLTAYLHTPQAKAIFASAERALGQYRPRFRENQRVVQATHRYLQQVPRSGGDNHPARYCPAQ